MRRRKIEELNQTHGKVENPITLDQIWGDQGEKYGTFNLEEYEKEINDFNKSDLQAHALKVGLVPVDDRNILIARLKKEFIKYVSMYKQPSKSSEKTKLSKSSKDTLSEGK
jgi:hypothetical protein